MKPRTRATLDLYERLKRDAKAGGYYLNPDVEFVLDLVEGLAINEARQNPVLQSQTSEGPWLVPRHPLPLARTVLQ
jgi:hypothetical protein